MDNPLLIDDPDLRYVWRWIAQALWLLPRRERFVMLARYGYLDGETWTLERTAKHLGVGRQSVREIERDAEIMLVRICSRETTEATVDLSILRRSTTNGSGQ